MTTSGRSRGREQRHPEVDVGILLLGEHDVEVAGSHDADLARPEDLGERLAVLRLGGRVDLAFLVHHAGPFERLGDGVADERLVTALGGLDLSAGRPDHRSEREDVAPGAVARQVVAVVAVIGMADPTTIVTATDQMAIGALHAAHALGVNVPHDVSIVGFDDIPLARGPTAPPLTTVHQPMGEMAELAVSLAIGARMSGDLDRQFPTTLSIPRDHWPGPGLKPAEHDHVVGDAGCCVAGARSPLGRGRRG